MLEHLSIIRLEGEASAHFLQGQVTCDVRDVSPIQTRFAAHCNPKGRVLSAFRIIQYPTSVSHFAQAKYYLIAPQTMQAPIISQLSKYALFSKVKLVPEEDLHVFGIMAEQAIQALSAHLEVPLPEKPDQAVFNKDCLVIRAKGHLPRFEVIASHDFAMLDATATEQTWRRADIEAQMAPIYPATSGLFTPHHLNYPNMDGVSFKKGCYTGQEIVARTHYLGQSKRALQLVRLPLSHALQPGDPWSDEHEQKKTVVEAVAGFELGLVA